MRSGSLRLSSVKVVHLACVSSLAIAVAGCSSSNTTRFASTSFQDPIVTGSVTPRAEVGGSRQDRLYGGDEAWRTNPQYAARPNYEQGRSAPAAQNAARQQAYQPPASQSQAAPAYRASAAPAPVSSQPIPTPQNQTAAYQPPQPAVQRAPASTGGRYTVVAGDTAYSIARTHGVPLGSLLSANGISDPASLGIGQQLVIPGASAPQAAPSATKPPVQSRDMAATAPSSQPAAAGDAHVVSSGETLYSIGRQYGVRPGDIVSANGLSDMTRIQVGQRLTIPGGRPATPAARESQPIQTAALQQPAATDTGGPKAYIPPQSGTAPSGQPSSETKTAKLPKPTQMSSASFRWPAEGRIISGFGAKTNGARNDGINIAVPEGTLIRAAENGVVAYAGNELKGFGNLILVRHANDWVTAYAHASEISVKRGDRINRGQVIGKAGKTGAVDSPQLHFEVRKGSKPVDPMAHLTKA